MLQSNPTAPKGPVQSFMAAPLRGKALVALLIACATLLVAALAMRVLKEQGGTNSFALVADSFLNLRPYVNACFDVDCAIRDGHSYVVFPPLPGVVAMPLVALFGINTAGFAAIGVICFALSMLLWRRIFDKLDVDLATRPWLLAAIAFASPLYYVTLRAERVWFFAQSLAFLFVALALHEALSRRLFNAGLAIGLAFLCRQMSIFYTPILLLLTFRPDEPLLRFTAERFRNAILIALPVLAAIGCYFAYNYWRFGNPLDTGYSGIAFGEGMLKARTGEFGLWNKAYVPFNLFYLLVQGFHVEFADPQKISLLSMDNNGSSILAASPWLLFLFFAPFRRFTAFAWLMILSFSGLLLFYHSNGFSQYNTQRYILDWLPVALVVLASVFHRSTMKAGWADMLKLLVTWGAVLNAVTVAVLAITHGN